MKRIALGLSGGVDSTAAAILLLEQGYDVTGVYLVLGQGDPPSHLPKVAARLGIPLEVVEETRQQFERMVVGRFLDDLRKGLTPNPCAYCNAFFKFGVMWTVARRLGADLMASGHYARFEGTWIRRATDRNKDQSYFLWGVRPDLRPRIVTPLGAVTRAEAEEIVRTAGIHIPERSSVDICFAPMGVESFLQERIHLSPGAILDKTGRKLGQHAGMELFTIGQRKGLGIPSRERMFVLRKDGADLVVGGREDLKAASMNVRDVVWAPGLKAPPRRCLVQFRYRTPPVRCTLEWNDASRVCVRFEEDAYAIAPGQAAVFYGDGSEYPEDLQLGGGWIESSTLAWEKGRCL